MTIVQSGEMRSLEHKDFNRDEIEKLKAILGNLEKLSITCSLAHSSEFPISIGLNVLDETFINSLGHGLKSY